MAGIVRTQTEAEKDLTPISSDGESTGFIPIMGPNKKPGAEEAFIIEAKKQEQIAKKASKPFAMQVAIEEFNEYFEQQAKKSMRKHGYVKAGDIKPLKVDWAKYSDLANFEVIDERTRNDEHLSKIYKLRVDLKLIKYKFKGYKYLYTVMETPESAIQRANK